MPIAHTVLCSFLLDLSFKVRLLMVCVTVACMHWLTTESMQSNGINLSIISLEYRLRKMEKRRK